MKNVYKLIILFSAIIISACESGDDSVKPIRNYNVADKNVTVEVIPSNYYYLYRITDSENRIVCYGSNSRTLSCVRLDTSNRSVKTNPFETK